MERTGPLSYKITVGDKVFHRHIDQICKVHPQVHISVDSENIDKGSHLQGTCPPTITPLRSGLSWVHKKVLWQVDLREAGVPVLNSAPESREAPIPGGNQQPTVQATPVASGRPDFVPVVKSYPTRQRKQPVRYGYVYCYVNVCILIMLMYAY